MRILLLVDCYLPSTKSSAKLVHDLAAELLRRGHQPVVVAPDSALRGRVDVRNEQGIEVLRVRTGRIKGASLARRAINEWLLSAVMWRAGKRYFREHPCDAVVFYSPSIFLGSLVQRLKRLWHCPAYLILRDIFPQWAVDAGVLRSGSLPHRLFRGVELKQYAAADVIGVQSPANLEYFEDGRTPCAAPREVLYNWMPLDVRSEAPGLREQLGLADKVVFFYGGNIGVAQDMDNLVRLAEALRERTDAHFLLVGEGSEVPRLEKLVAEKGLTNFTLHRAVPQEQYLGAVGEFDVGLISLDRALRTHNFPGKMLDYMAQRMPILASINPGNDLRRVIEEADAGRVCLNGEDDALCRSALELLDDADLRQRLGANARHLLETTFSVDAAAERILSHFQ
jgi:glycosyltransferase involved in cell wall biosynthesis